MSLVDKLKTIQEAIQKRIEETLGEEVNSVVVGSKDKVNKLKPPFIWVRPVQSPVDSQGLALHEEWNLNYWVISVVRSTKDPDEARDLSEELALKASGGLMQDILTDLQDRSLGNLVSYIKRMEWSPGEALVLSQGESLYGAGARMQIRLENEEVY
jgi:hypothetical protein